MTDAWFEVQHFPHGITMIREPHQSEDVKSYLVEGERDVAIIDTGTGAGDFPGLVASLSSKRPRVLQSHGHWDHAGHSYAFDEVLIHPSEVEGCAEGSRRSVTSRRSAQSRRMWNSSRRGSIPAVVCVGPTPPGQSSMVT